MSWLSQFVKHNRDFAGNALKNVSPLAFLIPGVGPLAAAGLGAAGSALGRGIQHGANFGNIVKQGAEGGAMAYGGAELTGGNGHALSSLRNAFAPSSSPMTTMPGVASPIQAGAGAIQGPGSAALNVGDVPSPPPSFLSQLASGAGHAAEGIGSFIKANPNAVGGALQGLGSIGSMSANNDYRRAETQQLNNQNQMSQYELQALKNRQAALEPLYRALLGQQQGIASNPYAPGNPYATSGGGR